MTCEQCGHDREKHSAKGCTVGVCDCGRVAVDGYSDTVDEAKREITRTYHRVWTPGRRSYPCVCEGRRVELQKEANDGLSYPCVCGSRK